MEKYLKTTLAGDPDRDTGLLVVGLAEHLMAAKEQRTKWGWTMKLDQTPHPNCQEGPAGEALAQRVIDHIRDQALNIVAEASKKPLKGEALDGHD